MLRAVLGKGLSDIINHHTTDFVRAPVGVQQIVGKSRCGHFGNLLVLGDRRQLVLIQTA